MIRPVDLFGMDAKGASQAFPAPAAIRQTAQYHNQEQTKSSTNFS
jgi:hypothetical protein